MVTGEYRDLQLMCWCQQHQGRYRRCLLLNGQWIPQLIPEPQRAPPATSTWEDSSIMRDSRGAAFSVDRLRRVYRLRRVSQVSQVHQVHQVSQVHQDLFHQVHRVHRDSSRCRDLGQCRLDSKPELELDTTE